MVYNVTYTPTDMAGIFQDMMAEYLLQFIVWAGVIVGVLVVILLIRAFKRR